MKPHVICHMMSSIDGRILPSRWRPQVASRDAYERLHQQLAGDAWLVGRVTGQEFAKASAYPQAAKETFSREPWLVRREAASYAIALDAHGKIAWGRSDIDGDPIVVVLGEQVSDAHLAGLRRDGVSYIFAGRDELDLRAALETLNRELAIERLLVEGGGGVNGSFLRAGLVDEISLLIAPTVDGSPGAPSVFDAPAPQPPAPVRSMALVSSEALDSGIVWLRYRLEY